MSRPMTYMTTMDVLSASHGRTTWLRSKQKRARASTETPTTPYAVTPPHSSRALVARAERILDSCAPSQATIPIEPTRKPALPALSPKYSSSVYGHSVSIVPAKQLVEVLKARPPRMTRGFSPRVTQRRIRRSRSLVSATVLLGAASAAAATPACFVGLSSSGFSAGLATVAVDDAAFVAVPKSRHRRDDRGPVSGTTTTSPTSCAVPQMKMDTKIQRQPNALPICPPNAGARTMVTEKHCEMVASARLRGSSSS
mmetsp:Transcript_19472/g.77509  ORF Transcript_19472/g.77509 Transcript_19472/m.77509 type:complete len:255 (-) Transcript_19472:510-1274(-)